MQLSDTVLYLSNLSFLVPLLVLTYKKKHVDLGIILGVSALFVGVTFCELTYRDAVGMDSGSIESILSSRLGHFCRDVVVNAYNLAIFVQSSFVLHMLMLDNLSKKVEWLNFGVLKAWVVVLYFMGVSLAAYNPKPFVVNCIISITLMLPDFIMCLLKVRVKSPIKYMFYPLRMLLTILVLGFSAYINDDYLSRLVLFIYNNLLYLSILRLKNCPYLYKTVKQD